MAFLRFLLKTVIVVLFVCALLYPVLPQSFSEVPSVGPRSLFETLSLRVLEPTYSFLDRKIDLISTWPVAVLIVAFLLLRSTVPSRIFPDIFRRVKSIGAFGVNLELEQQFDAFVREGEDLKELLPRLRSSVTAEVSKQTKDLGIESAFKKFVQKLVSFLAAEKQDLNKSKIRATIHIEDPLFDGQIMQLLEYVNGEGDILPGDSAGRSFSIRRGIVGRCWRSLLPEIRGLLTADQKQSATEDQRRIVAQTWGLTLDEAQHFENYPSYISIPVETGEAKFVVYVDSKLEGAFGTVNEIAVTDFITEQMEDAGLSKAIGEISKKFSKHRMRIESW
jgi:hypothetical protein